MYSKTWRQIHGYPSRWRIRWEYAMLWMMEFELAIGLSLNPLHRSQLKQDILKQESLIFRLENML